MSLSLCSRSNGAWLQCPTCVKGVSLAVVAALGSPLAAEDDFTGWFDIKERSYNFFDASYLYAEEAELKNSDQDLGWSQAKIRAYATVYNNIESDWSLWAGLQRSEFDGDIVLPDGRLVPDEVSNLRVGSSYRYRRDEFMVGGSVVYQSSGEDVVGGDDSGIQGSAFGQSTVSPGWTIWGFLQYEGIIEDEAVFGGGFRYTDDRFDVLIGYPWSQVSWRPIEQFMAKAIYYGDPWYADLTWFVNSSWRVGVAAQQRHEAFYYDYQPEDNYQIQLRQMQIDAFVSYELPRYQYLTVRVGQLVDRELFADTSYQSDSDNAFDIEDGLVTELAYSMWW